MPKNSFKKIKQTFIPIITLLLLVPSLLLNAYFIFQGKTDEVKEGIKVIKVIDGDTFEIEGNKRIRLRNVDAPDAGLCLSQEAKEFLAGLIEGKHVVLKEIITGQQNRSLVLVYVDNTLVNLEVIKNGLGRYHHDKSSQEEVLKKAGLQAKEKKLGVYSSKCYQKDKNLDNPDCVIKGNIDKNKYVDNKKYYFPGCAQYEFTVVEKDLGEDWFCTEKEAQKAGFVKADSCYDKEWN